MPISSISQPVSTMPTLQSGRTDGPTNEITKDAFLQLLVAQLRYQDPMSPAGPGEFMAQTAQFTMVEKLTELAAQGQATNQALGLSAASDLIGRTVSWIGPDNTTVSGRVTAALSTIDGVRLQIGDEKIPLEAVTGIS